MGVTLSVLNGQSQENHIQAVTPVGSVNTPIASLSTSRQFGVSNNWYRSPTNARGFRFTHTMAEHLNDGAGGFTLRERASNSTLAEDGCFRSV